MLTSIFGVVLNRWCFEVVKMLSSFLALLVIAGLCSASEVDDCVLVGLKGVNSDVAARMVREACERKISEKSQRENYQKYGEIVRHEMQVVSLDVKKVEAGDYRALVTVENPTSNTALLVRLQLWSVYKFLGEDCSASKGKDIYLSMYKVKIKPAQQADFIAEKLRMFPGDMFCAKATIFRSREPSSFDFSFGRYNVMTQAEFEDVVKRSEWYSIGVTPTSIFSGPAL